LVLVLVLLLVLLLFSSFPAQVIWDPSRYLSLYFLVGLIRYGHRR
jgi:hypothetical protein